MGVERNLSPAISSKKTCFGTCSDNDKLVCTELPDCKMWKPHSTESSGDGMHSCSCAQTTRFRKEGKKELCTQFLAGTPPEDPLNRF